MQSPRTHPVSLTASLPQQPTTDITTNQSPAVPSYRDETWQAATAARTRWRRDGPHSRQPSPRSTSQPAAAANREVKQEPAKTQTPPWKPAPTSLPKAPARLRAAPISSTHRMHPANSPTSARLTTTRSSRTTAAQNAHNQLPAPCSPCGFKERGERRGPATWSDAALRANRGPRSFILPAEPRPAGHWREDGGRGGRSGAGGLRGPETGEVSGNIDRVESVLLEAVRGEILTFRKVRGTLGVEHWGMRHFSCEPHILALPVRWRAAQGCLVQSAPRCYLILDAKEILPKTRIEVLENRHSLFSAEDTGDRST